MTTPVAQSAPTTRPGRAQDRPDPAGAAGFASALDGALSGGRDPVGPRATDARSERRNPDNRAADAADRAADKAADAADRAADKASRVADRAADASARAAAEADRAGDRAADRADGEAPPDEETDVPVVGGPDAESTEQPGGTEAAAGRTGLPAAIWALLMGRSATAPSAEAAPGETTAQTVAAIPATAVAAAAVPAGPAVAAGLPEGAPTVAVPAGAALPAAALPSADPALPGAVPAAAAALPDAPGAAVPAAAPAAPPAPATAPTPSPVEGLTVVTSADVATAPATEPVVAIQTPRAAPLTDAAPDPVPTLTAADGEVPVPAAGAATSDSTSSGDAGASTPQTPAPVPTADAAEPAAPTSTSSAVGPAPATTTAPAATAPAGATGAGAAQHVGAQVARHVAVLRGAPDGSHTMTLVLTPDTLGPVEVQVTVSKGNLDLTLRGAHEHGRAALLDALPDLRRDLEQAGLSVTRAEVARDGGGSRFDQQSSQADRQQAFGDRGGQGRGDSRSRPWAGPADTTGGPTPAYQRTTSSGVDVRV